MNRNRLFATLLAALLGAQFIPPAPQALASAPSAGPDNAVPAVRARAPRITDSFRMRPADGTAAKVRPDWAIAAEETVMSQIAERPRAFGLASADEVRLFGVDRDELGRSDVRLDQRHGGVDVIGGQLIVRLDTTSRVSSVGGHVFDVAGAATAPQIDEASAIRIASAAAGRLEGLTVSSRLVLVPNALMHVNDDERGGTLAYEVHFAGSDRNIERGKKIFVDARSGLIVWRFGTTPHASGVGYGEYSGRVTIITDEYEEGWYRMIDSSAGNSEVHDAYNNTEDLEDHLFENNSANVWGDGNPADAVTAAVDAHFAVNETWRYYRDRHGRLGADGNGTRIKTFVHFGSEYNNASGADSVIVLGDGDGVSYGSFAALDVVAHEFTHSVVQATSGVPYSGEGGAIDEALCDIFGTAVEFRSGRNPDFFIGEDVVRSGHPRTNFRDMSNPTVSHLSQKVYAGGCSPDGDNDNCGVHTNSGIVNNVFYLLSVGGTHAVSGVKVPKIGREVAEDIFYEAMSRHMFAGTNFYRMAHATLSGATDLYGYNSKQYKAVRTAWQAVGVLEGERPADDFSTWKTLAYASYDGSAQTGRVNPEYGFDNLTTYGASSFANGWTSIVRLGTDILYYNRDTALAAIGHLDANGDHHTTHIFHPGFLGSGWSHIVAMDGNVFFYNEATGEAAMGRFTGPLGFTQYGYRTGFSLWWTHIVNAQGRLLFYNQNTGVAAVCVLDEIYGQADGLFRTLTEIRCRQLRPAQYIAQGWSSIVDTKDGVLFYNIGTGQYVVADIDTGGTITDRQPDVSPAGRPMWAYSSLGQYWTHIERVKDVLLLYSTYDGSAMTLTMYSVPVSRRLVWGKHEPVVFRQQFAMQPGWTHIVGAIDEVPVF